MFIKFLRWIHNSLNPVKFREGKFYRYFGEPLLHPDLWKFSMKSVARAWLISIFSACSPFLGLHMLMSIAGAFVFRANLPLCAALVWINNPVTMLIYYPIAYWLGCKFFHYELLPKINWPYALTHGWEIFWFLFVRIWEPLLLGCTFLGILFGLLGYLLIYLLWPRHKR